MGGTRLFTLSILESKADNLTCCIRGNDLLGSFSNRGKHAGKVKILMACQLHAFCLNLAGNGDKRCPVKEGISNPGHQIGSTRPKR